MTAEEFMQKLQAAVEGEEVGVELWFSTAEWRDAQSEGRSFVDFAEEMFDRKL